MRPPRFRLRTLMVAVAAAGVVVFPAIEGERRRQQFEGLASFHAAMWLGASLVSQGGDPLPLPDPCPVPGTVVPGADDPYLPGKIALHRTLMEKYRRAARYPWLPVPPDQPPPE